MSIEARMGPGREFDAIRELLSLWGDAARGVGDDAAVVDVPAGERLVVSADSSVENVHFRRDWLRPSEIGWRAAVAALSDLAAMAATPLGVLVSFSVPPEWREELGELAGGVGEAVVAAGTQIVGGDLTGARDLTIAVTVLGHAAAPLTRGGARAGDTLYVTGVLGGPRAAIAALERGEVPPAAARERLAHPTARIRESRWLARYGANAAIDISDGLAGDAAHVAAASGARLVLVLDGLPTVGGSSVADATASGEEYELLVAARQVDTAAFEREFGVPITPIGRVERGAAEVQALIGGARVALGGGFDHFS